MGCTYKRGNVWWIKYYRAGKSYQESSKSAKESVAKRMLKLREGQVAEGKFPGLKVDRIRFDELAQDLINEYKVNGRKTLDRVELSIANLKGHFEGVKVVDINSERINAYIMDRQGRGRANGTINRELATLKRMFKLGALATPPKVVNIPYIPHLKEAAPRSGYFEYAEYKALLKALPDYLKPVITMAYYTGMRAGEVLSLQWHQVDLNERKITLEAGKTKNGEGRVVFMEGELFEAIRFQLSVQDSKYPDSDLVFFNYKTGAKIGSFRKAWATACKEAKLTGRIFHDFRRTAVRNMVRAGIPERVAMMISGHKTRNVFERYNIVNEDDLKKASRKVTDYHSTNEAAQDVTENGYNLVTIGEKEVPEKTLQ